MLCKHLQLLKVLETKRLFTRVFHNFPTSEYHAGVLDYVGLEYFSLTKQMLALYDKIKTMHTQDENLP